MLSGKKIILGVTGSIAVYKAAYLVRLLVKEGAEVKVISTDSANHFVTDLTFQSLSQKPVFRDLWKGDWTEHVHLGQWADLLLVAPASANTLAKMANGTVDNALTAVFLASKCPVIVAPAMDAEMYSHINTQENIANLRRKGFMVLEGAHGEHASGLMGPGRFAEPDEILEEVRLFFTLGAQKDSLLGKKVLITTGPTREMLDPVRFLSNLSTGKMGFALAKVAKYLGAEVTLISGPVALDPPREVEYIPVLSAVDLLAAVSVRIKEQDLLIMAAAVADYCPTTISSQKIKKKEGELSIPLKRTPDILLNLAPLKKTGQVFVGFALETQNEIANALRKLETKNLDMIVLNSLQDKGAAFGHDTNKITILLKNGEQESFPLKSKIEVAADILQKVVNIFNNGQ